MRLSAALIVRDEAAHLATCLSLIQSLVDEIVVVDTGSADESPAIAERHGAVLIREPWRDDFAHARNVALGRATGDWILYVDADERATVTGDLRAALAPPDLVAARVPFRASTRLTPYLEHRLFRNRPDLRFRGAIHETILPDLRAIVAREGLRVGEAPLHIEHLGYEGDLAAKHRRNLPLLQRAVREDPGRLYLWHALGEAELGLGDTEAARRAWDRGLALVAEAPPSAGEARLLADRIGLALDAGEAAACVAPLVERAERRHPDDPLALWVTARWLVERREFAAARAKLERLIDWGPDGPAVAELGYDLALFRELPHALTGVCLLQEGNPAHAEVHLRQAEAYAPGNTEIRLKRELAAARAAASQ